MGALTSKPYAFTARSWELKSFDSLDFFDSFLMTVRYDLRGTEVMRILPRKTENEEWITDKVRFMYDGLRRQRLYRPYVRVWEDVQSTLVPVSWSYALQQLSYHAKTSVFNFHALSGNFVDVESQLVLKELASRLGGSFSDANFLTPTSGVDFRSDFLFDLQSFENADMVILVGCDLRFEAPMLNLKLRRRVNSSSITVVRFGFTSNLTYESYCFGGDLKSIIDVCTGKNDLAFVLSKIARGYVLTSSYILDNNESLLNVFGILRNKLSFKISVLPTSASTIGFFNLGVLSNNLDFSASNWLYLLDADTIEFSKGFYDFSWHNLVIYQGHHGDINAGRADFVLPGVLPVEKQSTFIDLKGDVKRVGFLIPPAGEARVDWHILVALSDFLTNSLPFRDFSMLQLRLGDLGVFCSSSNKVAESLKRSISLLHNVGLQRLVDDFYLSDSITRSSLILALTSNRFSKYNKMWW